MDGDEVEVNFMEKKGSFYAWSSVQEKSWENVSAIKKRYCQLQCCPLTAQMTDKLQVLKFYIVDFVTQFLSFKVLFFLYICLKY
jgi:hypothetical protein